MKKEFCRNFCMDCKKCKDTWEEVQKEEKIFAQVIPPLYHRTNLEKAALDCKGRP